MGHDSPRIAELRRRVQADPASIAFAQLAEEYRRAGHYEEAVKYCRAGLARHPSYLSARVTLGRALMELDGLDEAALQFDTVLRTAPENLAAIRGMAEIHQRQGRMDAALDYYKRALALARFDSDLEETVARIARELGSEPQEGAADAAEPFATPDAPEPLIDFDALLAALGVPDATPPPAMQQLLSDSGDPPPASLLPDAPPNAPAGDPFAGLERELRRVDGLVGETPPEPVSAEDARRARADERAVQELEGWLRVLASDRPLPPRG